MPKTSALVSSKRPDGPAKSEKSERQVEPNGSQSFNLGQMSRIPFSVTASESFRLSLHPEFFDPTKHKSAPSRGCAFGGAVSVPHASRWLLDRSSADVGINHSRGCCGSLFPMRINQQAGVQASILFGSTSTTLLHKERLTLKYSVDCV